MRYEIDKEDTKNKLVIALKGLGVDMVEALQTKVPVATSFLRDNINYDVIVEGDKVIFEINMPYYGKYVEYGSAPGENKPSIQDIKDWCKVKGIDDKWLYPIWRHIIEHGTRPQPFIRPYVDTKFMNDLANNLKLAFK